MKKIVLCLFVILFSFSESSFAQVLTGGVNYSVNDARVELQNNRPPAIDFLLIQDNLSDTNLKLNQSYLLEGKTDLNDRTLGLFSDESYAVCYKNDPYHVWYYSKNGELIYAEVKTSLTFPYRTYKYTSDGEIENMTLRVSEGETFIFSSLGQLLGHWIGKNCYDENGKILMTRKILK